MYLESDMPDIPGSVLLQPAVQAVLILLLMAGMVWIGQRVIKHGEDIKVLKIIVTNHYQHRFKKIEERLGIEYDDDSE